MSTPKCENCNDNPDQWMVAIAGYDNPYPAEGVKLYAYNVYQCKYCGVICIDHVWADKGKTWVTVEGTVKNDRGTNR